MRTAWTCFTCLALAAGATLPATSSFATGQPPSLQLLVAPANGDTVYYGFVPFSWQGTDPDGSVSLYRYAIDPDAPGGPSWVQTSRTLNLLFFTCRYPVDLYAASGPVVFAKSHTLVAKAVDDEGLESAPVSRTFVSYTIAPEVHVTAPTPNPSPFFRPRLARAPASVGRATIGMACSTIDRSSTSSSSSACPIQATCST